MVLSRGVDEIDFSDEFVSLRDRRIVLSSVTLYKVRDRRKKIKKKKQKLRKIRVRNKNLRLKIENVV